MGLCFTPHRQCESGDCITEFDACWRGLLNDDCGDFMDRCSTAFVATCMATFAVPTPDGAPPTGIFIDAFDGCWFDGINENCERSDQKALPRDDACYNSQFWGCMEQLAGGGCSHPPSPPPPPAPAPPPSPVPPSPAPPSPAAAAAASTLQREPSPLLHHSDAARSVRGGGAASLLLILLLLLVIVLGSWLVRRQPPPAPLRPAVELL